MDPFRAQETRLKAHEGKDPCLPCFPHGLEYNTGTQLWRKNKDNRTGSKAVTLPDISCFYVNAMTPCDFFPLNKTNFSKIKKKKKSHVSWHILHFDSYSRAKCLIVLNDQGVSGTFFFFFFFLGKGTAQRQNALYTISAESEKQGFLN